MVYEKQQQEVWEQVENYVLQNAFCLTGKRDSDSALRAAVRSKDIEQVKLLLDNGRKKVKQEDIWGDTCLHLAAKLAEPDLVDLLLKNGASATSLNRYGYDPLCVALYTWGAQIETKYWRWNFLHPDCDYDDEIESRYPDKVTNHIKCIKLLLDAGADVNHVTKDDRTPLFIAMRAFEHSEVIHYLLSRGASLNYQKLAECLLYVNNRSLSKKHKYLIKRAALCDVVAENGGWKEDNWDEAFENFTTECKQRMRDEYMRCINEIIEMKNTPFDSRFTLFDVITSKQSGFYIRSSKANQNFDTKVVKELYPIYHDVLIENHDLAVKMHLVKYWYISNIMSR